MMERQPLPPVAEESPTYDARQEKYQLSDSVTGLNTPVRSLSDDQLLRAWRKVKQQHAVTNNNVANAVAAHAAMQATMALIDYEIDRRRRVGIVLATELPRT